MPIGPPLGKLVDLFGTKDAAEAVLIGDESGEVFGVCGVDEIDLGDFAQGGKILGEVVIVEGGNVGGVVVHVADEDHGISKIKRCSARGKGEKEQW